MPTFTIPRPAATTVEFPTAELIFGSDGAPADAGALTAIRMELADAGVTDLIVLCGGWAEKDSELRFSEPSTRASRALPTPSPT